MAAEQSKPKGPDLGRGIPFGDVPDGSMLAGHVGDDAVLLVRRGKEFFACGARGTTPASVCARARRSARRPSIRCRAGGSRPAMEKHSCRTKSSRLIGA